MGAVKKNRWARKNGVLRRCLQAQKGKCCYCGKSVRVLKPEERRGRLPHDAATREHLRRKADGGTDRADNIAIACHDCNTNRGETPWNLYKSIRLGEVLP